MLGSEVIKQIQNLIDEYGDLPNAISIILLRSRILNLRNLYIISYIKI